MRTVGIDAERLPRRSTMSSDGTAPDPCGMGLDLYGNSYEVEPVASTSDSGHAWPGVSRRKLFRRTVGAGVVAGSVAIPADTRGASIATAPDTTAAVTDTAFGFETLTASAFGTLEAITACLIPTDENGPRAIEADAAHFIDRASGSPALEIQAVSTRSVK